MEVELTPELVLYGYQNGFFPMAYPPDPTIYWYAPDPRAIIPLNDFHIPKTLAKLVRRERFEVTADQAFEHVIRACADRESTWISEEIIVVYVELHKMGFAHSLECWDGSKLAGGLYGVALGGAFFGESMFHWVTDASKVALVHLVNRLRQGGFILLDTQFITPHLAHFGAIEITRKQYLSRLSRALNVSATWLP